ncbi:MAG TPA: glutamate-cysteine ligase family protein [Candidatus Paceibacterota bacterium]|nr:glutamate-cysteine ligase family protein [Candidatus Paceibacterota bacterium]
MSDSYESFRSQFAFSPERTLKLGVERECFIVDAHGMPVPRAPEVLTALHAIEDPLRFTYELSACQIESRTRPCGLAELKGELSEIRETLEDVVAQKGLGLSYTPVGPENMPLDVYFDERYRQITRTFTRERLLAACRLIATHIHVGMPDHETALHVYEHVRKHVTELCLPGNAQGVERLRIYREFTPTFEPPELPDWEAFHRYAVENNFTSDIRQWWSIVRISRHGTIEFRMFDACSSDEQIVTWARTVRTLCMGAM